MNILPPSRPPGVANNRQSKIVNRLTVGCKKLHSVLPSCLPAAQGTAQAGRDNPVYAGWTVDRPRVGARGTGRESSRWDTYWRPSESVGGGIRRTKMYMQKRLTGRAARILYAILFEMALDTGR